MKVLITGASGFIGRELGKALVRDGHEVVALTRNASEARQALPYPARLIEGDLNRGPLNAQLLADVEAVVHLAGENVGDGRWSEERKGKILQSREDFTRHLMQSLPASLKVFVSSSAIGIYGSRGDETLNENSAKGSGFLADVCEKWEAAVESNRSRIPQARVVIFRTSVVFSAFGGALMKMLTPFQMGVGGVLGSGSQWMSWIHLKDLVAMFREALKDSQWSGLYNAVAPDAVTNREFTGELCEALGVWQGPPVPALALKTLYGEMSSVILDSQKVESLRLNHFKFEFPRLKAALADCAGPYRDGHQIFYAEQYFPLSRHKVFPFFAKAENLEAITPPLLNFHVKAVSTPQIEKGTLIDYDLKIRGVPVTWRTLIDEWKPDEVFVDTQLKGPYSHWHHTHRFEDLGAGTLMTDVVRYKLPLGKLGALLGGSFVKGDVEEIFAYRRKVVPEMLAKA